MTPQEEELARQIIQKLDDQVTMIVEYFESMAKDLASINRKLARIESLRTSTYAVDHGASRWGIGHSCTASKERRGRRCLGPWRI